MLAIACTGAVMPIRLMALLLTTTAVVGWTLSNTGVNHWIDRFGFRQTTGSIYVNGPQVYTRERLVNDRYREDTWLTGVLNDASKQHFSWNTIVSAENRSNLSLTGALSLPSRAIAPVESGAAASDRGPPSNANTETSDGKSDTANRPDVLGMQTAASELSPFQQFYELLTYRERIRAHIIENQLDDRHDLRGNSLYRLVFDAAVLPGNNTRMSARISVSVLPPEGLLDYQSTTPSSPPTLEEQEGLLANLTSLTELKASPHILDSKEWAWARIYNRWLESLGKRFEDARRSMRQAYDRNLFSPNDYNLLLDTVRTEARNYATVMSSLNTTLLNEQERVDELKVRSIDDTSTRPDPVSTVVSNAQLSAARANALMTLYSALISDADSYLSISPQNLSTFTNYQNAYYTGINKQNSTYGAKSFDTHDVETAYQTEIRRLIDALIDERLLWSLLSFGVRSDSHGVVSSHGPRDALDIPQQQAQQPPASNLTQAANQLPSDADDSCKKILLDYATGKADLTPYMTRVDVKFDLKYFMDVSFEDGLIKSVLGLAPQTERIFQAVPLLNGARDTRRNQLPSLLRFASVEPRFGSSGPAFIFKPRVVQLIVTNKLDCLPANLRNKALKTSFSQHEIFVSQGDIDNIRQYLPEFDREKYIRQTFPNGLTNQVAYSEVQIGLINFIRTAGRRLDAFSYAFPASEPDENVATHFVNVRKDYSLGSRGC
jgi:hypothetical protein